MDSFWWGLMVLTTVGYGEKVPHTWAGQLIGGLCALIGVFILALPVPIVVNSFASNYKNRVWRNEVMMKKQMQERSEPEKADNGIQMRTNLKNGNGADVENNQQHGGGSGLV